MLVTLRGCHLLDGLVVLSVEVHKKTVQCSGEVIMRGIVLAPREPCWYFITTTTTTTTT
jgi:hypothetical protein